MAGKVHKLVMMRHGESVFTVQNLFCGFGNDADLTNVGISEAVAAGQRLVQEGYEFDVAFTSQLKRAVKTLFLMQEEMDCHWMPVVKTWRLNERHYGALQGLGKAETAEKYGEKQVKVWRRSWDVRPPPLEKSDPRWCGSDRAYKHLDARMMPNGESLKDTVERILPCWHDEIAPLIKSGKRVLIIAHGNTLRGIAKYIEKISDEDIVKLEFPQAIPLVYELNENLEHVNDYYLASEKHVRAAKKKIGVKGNVQ